MCAYYQQQYQDRSSAQDDRQSSSNDLSGNNDAATTSGRDQSYIDDDQSHVGIAGSAQQLPHLGSELDIDAFIAQSLSPSKATEVEDLFAAWTAERTAPEVLPYQSDLMERLSMKLQAQLTIIEELDASNPKTNFHSILLQTELERIKFLMRAYLRVRIHKIDRFLYQCASDPIVNTKLSGLERQYVVKHQALLEKHFTTMFVKSLPASGGMRKFDDTAAAGLSMVSTADVDKSVFCRVVKPLSGQIITRSELVDAEVGNTLLISYKAVRHFIQEVRLE